MTGFHGQTELNKKSYLRSAALALIVLALIWGYNWVGGDEKSAHVLRAF